MTTGGWRLGLVIALAVAILAVLVTAGVFDRDERGERPAPAGKVMSPPAVEPLPAPRARGQLGTPATQQERQPESGNGNPEPGNAQ